MFFTQEDYIKIQQWLAKNSVKDTEFNEATIPFNGNEIVSIVQGNQNKKVFLKDLVSQIFNLGVSDFVNITDKYDAPNISLEEAIRLIPSRARKEGQVITFLDMEDHWHIYQFKGALNQWNVLDTWEDLFDWEKLIIDSILPDEEDLTKSPADENGNSYLSLKDREYNPEDFSGLGRVIIRKNIVELEDPIYGKVKKNVLTQDMINKSNTIYEIRYDFDLNGAEITIPEGCVLDFQGGSLNNGIITNNNTIIKSSMFTIFDNIELTGTVCNNDILDIWFNYDLNKLLNLSITNYYNVIISKNYLIHQSINIGRDNFGIIGNGYEIKYDGNDSYILFIESSKDINNIILDNVIFNSTSDRSGNIQIIAKDLEEIKQIKTIKANKCQFVCNKQSFDEGLFLLSGNLSDINILDCTFKNNNTIINQNGYGLFVSAQNKRIKSESQICIKNNNFINLSGSFIHYSTGYIDTPIIFDGNNIFNCKSGFSPYHCNNCTIVNNIFNECGATYIWQSVNTYNNKWINCGKYPHSGDEMITYCSVHIEALEGNFSSNEIINSFGDGIWIQSGGRGFVSNNNIQICAGNGITVHSGEPFYPDAVVYCYIKNNIIRNVQKHGILFMETNMKHSLVDSNVIIGVARESNEYNAICAKSNFNLLEINNNNIRVNDSQYGIQDSKLEVAIFLGKNSKTNVINNYIESKYTIEYTSLAAGKLNFLGNTLSSVEDTIIGNAYYTQIRNIKNNFDGIPISGGSRPDLSAIVINQIFEFYDTKLNKPIWWTGTKWVDATGAEV